MAIRHFTIPACARPFVIKETVNISDARELAAAVTREPVPLDSQPHLSGKIIPKNEVEVISMVFGMKMKIMITDQRMILSASHQRTLN